MSNEGQLSDKKSLRAITGETADFYELAKDCVAFANARGGKLLIGIEDNDEQPPATQKIKDAMLEGLNKRIPQLAHNVGIVPRKLKADNGGEYIELQILHNPQSIAATSDGRYYIRVGDTTRKVMPDELTRLMNDKSAFVWETQTSQQILRRKIDTEKLKQFLAMVRASDRVSKFVKTKSDDEILEHYLFVKDDYLTNLGVLWIGKREDRATLPHAPGIQFIKYDEQERKVNKLTWDDHYLNPYELIEAVWSEVPDWRESYELSDGLFRKNVPHYDEVVVRELLANALVHRPYTQRGEIFLNLYADRLEVHNPGLLPVGVTPRNILHTSSARNDQLARVFRDLKLMEKEGSGYDRIYEVLLSNGKPIPEVIEGNDRVTVIVRKRIINPAIIDFVAKADDAFHLTQKERITLGLLAQNESLTVAELAKLLELRETTDAHHWLGKLLKSGIVKSKGQTKGKEYFVSPDLLRKLDFKGATSLKGIEAHRLQELILKDLQIYQKASISEIHERIGSEIPRRKVRHELQKLVEAGKINRRGKLKGARYFWTKKT